MISLLEGNLEYASDRSAIINAGGIGYRVTMIPKVLNTLSKSKDKVKLFIHSQLNMRDGTFDMYGFDKMEGLELFNLLISVSGIGPKNAMGILSLVEPHNLKAAILGDDLDYLKKIAGLGPKTAQRLILELKGKIDGFAFGGPDNINLTQDSQAIEALMALGYSMSDAKDVLKDIKAETLQERVREALKILGKKK